VQGHVRSKLMACQGSIVGLQLAYLLPEMAEADHGRRGLPSGDVLRAKSRTVISIILRVGSSALVSAATTRGAHSVLKLQYSSADLNLSSPATCFTQRLSARPCGRLFPYIPVPHIGTIQASQARWASQRAC